MVALQDLCKNFYSGKQTNVSILDFSKAFDTVPHNRLLHKQSSYSITGSLHLCLQNVLTQRRMQVVIEGEELHEVPVDSSVPQGTVLGPVLFLCHISSK